MKIPCSLPILTLNCESKLRKLLPLVVDVIEDVYIMDGNSTDGTREYAASLGVRVEKQFDHDIPNSRIVDFSVMRERLWSFAKYDWLLLLDADEEPTTDFLERVRTFVVSNELKKAYAFYPRVKLPDGHVVDRAFFYGNYYIRFFHKNSGCELAKRVMHERFIVPKDVIVVNCDERFICPWPSAEGLWKKQIRYLQAEAEKTVNLGRWAFFRWVIFYHLRSFFGQCLQTIWALIRAILRRENALPWSYAWVYHKYHLILIWESLKFRFRTISIAKNGDEMLG